jgi:uncharacterized protein
MRILILALLGYLLYRSVRRYLRTDQGTLRRHETSEAIDEMVQDPVCKTYVPMREAEKRVIGGKTYYFCSEKCAEEFEEQVQS